MLGYGSEYFSPGRRRFLKVKPTTLEYGYPRRNAFRQPVLEALLRERLADHKRATARFETELVGLSQSDAGVTATLRSGDRGKHEVTCDYLIGCDGSRSFVRQRLDIAMEGSTFNERWLIVDLEGTSDHSRDTKVYCDPSRPCLSLPGPHGTRRFEFMLHEEEGDEQVLNPENVASLLRSHGEGPESTIRRKVVYAFHARMAARWRCGKMFLAGDAAHLMPPFAGQGMNSGIRDAHNLAWKMAAIVKRELGPALLDTYEAERRGHAADMIELAVRMGQVMMPRTRTRAFALQTFFRMLALYPAARSYFAEMKYKPKPRFRQGFLINSGQPHEHSLVGALFPQALVATARGYQLLDDVLGDGFSLVAPPGTSTQLLQGVDAARGLKARLVAVLGREDTSTTADPIITVRDVRGDIATLLAPYPIGLYLLRPDRYVAACFAPHQSATMWKDIEMLCGSTWALMDHPPSAVRHAESPEPVGP